MTASILPLDALIAPDARVELVKDGFGFTEGPVWVQEGKGGYLLFTDMPGNVIWKLTPDGKASVHLSNVGYNGPEVWRWGGIQNNGRDRSDPRFEEFAMIGADGLTLDRQGRLIVATFAFLSPQARPDVVRVACTCAADDKACIITYCSGLGSGVTGSAGAISLVADIGTAHRKRRDRDFRKSRHAFTRMRVNQTSNGRSSR